MKQGEDQLVLIHRSRIKGSTSMVGAFENVPAIGQLMGGTALQLTIVSAH